MKGDKYLLAKEEKDAEMEALEAIYGDDFIMSEFDDRTHMFLRVSTLALEEEHEIILELELSPLYPFSLPGVKLDSNGVISTSAKDQLYMEMLEEASTKIGEPIIHDLFVQAQDFVINYLKEKANYLRNSSCLQIRVKAKKMWEALADESEIQDEVEKLENKNDGKQQDNHENDNKNAAFVDEFHYDMLDSLPKPSDYVSIMEIFSKLPQNLLVRKIEMIMRPDICERFEEKRTELKKKYGRGTSTIEYEPEIVFHGTTRNSVNGIIRTGLLVPGTRSGVHVRNGQAYGKGIYVGRTAEISLSYCDYSGDTGMLFVCAVVKGSNKNDGLVGDWGDFLVFNQSCNVLPLYVVHFGLDYNIYDPYLVMTQAGTLMALKTKPDQIKQDFNNRMIDKSSLHSEAKVNAKEVAKLNASFYFDTKKYQILDVADYDDDDDECRFMPQADEVSILDFDHSTGVDALDNHGCSQNRSYQSDRLVPTAVLEEEQERARIQFEKQNREQAEARKQRQIQDIKNKMNNKLKQTKTKKKKDLN